MNYFKDKTSQIQIGLMTGIIILMGSVATPILWITNINQSFAIQQTKQASDIQQLQQNYADLKADNKLISQKVDALLWRAGIDPAKIR